MRATIHFVANGSSGFDANGDTSVPLTLSQETVPAHSRLDAVDVSLTGDFSACAGGADQVFIKPYQDDTYQPTALASVPATRNGRYRAHSQLLTSITGSQSTPLAVYSVCYDANLTPVAMPSFTVTVTFDVTPLATAVTRDLG